LHKIFTLLNLNAANVLIYIPGLSGSTFMGKRGLSKQWNIKLRKSAF
jgi:hypothetical protein